MNPTALRQATEQKMNALIGMLTPTYNPFFTLGNTINLNGTDKPFRFSRQTRSNLEKYSAGKLRLTNFADVTQEFSVDEAEEVLNHFCLHLVAELANGVPERLEKFAKQYDTLGWKAPYASFLN